MDDYAQHPRSITEIRSGKTRDAADWTPRDVLIHVLRTIDSGEWEPQMLMVVSARADGSSSSTRYSLSSPNPLLTAGMLERVKHMLARDAES